MTKTEVIRVCVSPKDKKRYRWQPNELVCRSRSCSCYLLLSDFCRASRIIKALAQIESGRKSGEMLVGDIIMWRDKKFGLHRFWEIEAVLVGSEKEESLVRIRSLNYKPGHDEFGYAHAATLVPEVLLRNAEIYTKVQRE